jgi:hypothetical protein
LPGERSRATWTPSRDCSRRVNERLPHQAGARRALVSGYRIR